MRSRILLVFILASNVGHGQIPTTANNHNDDQPAGVEGIVLNSVTGAPISHAHVRFQDYSSSRVYGALSATDGKFSIASIAPGSYSTTVGKQGYLSPPSQQSSDGAITVELKTGQHLTDMSFRLVPFSVISGHVFNENNEPIENVTVEAIRGTIAGTALTNDRGEFRIGGLRAGRYLVKTGETNGNRFPPEIRSDGTTDTNYGPTYYPGTTDRIAALPVKTESGEERAGTDIRLVRIPIVRLSGRVLGVPKDAQGVSATLGVGHSGQSIQVGPDFQFTLWRLPPGTYWLSAQCRDISGKIWQGPKVRIDLANRNIDNVVFTLIPPFALSGKVVGHSSRAAHPGQGETSLQLVLGDSGIASVASDGSFEIPALPAGLYHITVNGLTHDEYVKGVRIGFSDFPGRTVDLRNGAPRAPFEVIVGHGTGKIEGIVYDDHERPTAAMVALLADDSYEYERPAVAYSDAHGKYSFPAVPPGSYKLFAFGMSDYSVVSASEDGLTLYERSMQKAEIGEGEKKSLNLTLMNSDD